MNVSWKRRQKLVDIFGEELERLFRMQVKKKIDPNFVTFVVRVCFIKYKK